MIYLDCNATTPTDPRVTQAMQPFFSDHFGNPASNHPLGWQAATAVEKARVQVLDLMQAATSDSLVFTSSATESNNLALFGYARANKGKGRHIISQATEHDSVLQPLQQLEEEGFEVSLLPVDSNGRFSLEALTSAIRPDTILVSIMAANNEIGTVHPIVEIGAICAQHQIAFHCDAVQAFGKIVVDTQKAKISLLSLSGHKMYGPKGIGALFIAGQTPPLRLKPILYGGGHERGLRSGTLATPLIVGLGEAAALISQQSPHGESEAQKLLALKMKLLLGLKEIFPRLQINGDPVNSLPNTLNISLPGVSNDSLFPLLSPLAFSFGSACGSQKGSLSHVLRAIGVTEPMGHSTLRLSLGRFTTLEDIERTLVVFNRFKEG